MLEAWAPSICEDKMAKMKVTGLSVQWAVVEHPGVMNRPRLAHIRADEAALMVTNHLQCNRGEQFAVPVAQNIRAAQRLDRDGDDWTSPVNP